MAHSTDEKPNQNALYLSVFLALVAAAGVFWFFSSQAPQIERVSYESFDFEKLEIDTNRLAEERAELKEGFAPGESGKAAIALFEKKVRAANLMQFGTPSSQEIRDAEIEIEFAANDAASAAGGFKYFVFFGSDLYHACQTQLATVLEALESGDVDYETMTTDPGADWNVYRETCGNVLPALVQMGLISKGGEWRRDYGPALFDILYRYRIASIIQLRMAPENQLTRHGRQSLWRWRIQDDVAFSQPERITAARRGFSQRLEGDTYPTPLEVAKIYVQAGDDTSAYETLEPWCEQNPEDVQLKQYCVFLKERVQPEG